MKPILKAVLIGLAANRGRYYGHGNVHLLYNGCVYRRDPITHKEIV